MDFRGHRQVLSPFITDVRRVESVSTFRFLDSQHHHPAAPAPLRVLKKNNLDQKMLLLPLPIALLLSGCLVFSGPLLNWKAM